MSETHNLIGKDIPKKCVDCGAIFIDESDFNPKPWFQCNCGQMYEFIDNKWYEVL